GLCPEGVAARPLRGSPARLPAQAGRYRGHGRHLGNRQPQPPSTLTPMNDTYVGIDFGGTHIKLGLVSADGELLAEAALDTARDQPIEETVETLVVATRDLIEREGAAPKGIGLGLTGPVN